MKRVFPKSTFVLLGLTLCTLWFAQMASAQAISGVVTDEKGAVVPGVEVTITSPAMIEGRRTEITNGAGRYSFVNLRPGTYEVTFALQGFATVKRPGVALTTDFVAPINAELKIAAVETTVTVEAAPPVVDVQSVSLKQVQTRSELDAIPTKSRDHQSLALTIPGTNPYGFGEVQYHGTNDAQTSVDGIRTSVISVGGVSFSGQFDNEMFQEMSFSTAMESPEMGQAGMMMNLIPKEGGNQYHGNVFFNFTTESFNGDNTQGIKQKYGVNLGSGQTLKYTDVNGAFGGPIIKDRLWFHVTSEYHGDRESVLNAFANASPDKTKYVPDTSNPMVQDPWRAQGSVRLTWQATRKDKITGLFDNQVDYQAHTDSGLTGMLGLSRMGPDSSLITDTPVQRNIQVRWTRIQSPKLLFDVSVSSYKNHLFFNFQDPYDAWSGRNVEDTSIPKLVKFNKSSYTTFYGDYGTGKAWGPFALADTNVSDTMTINPSLSYVTGSHVFKAGLHFFRGSYFHPQGVVGDIDLLTFMGFGFAAQIGGFFPPETKPKINGDYGWYVQDKWTIKRLTLNLGLRFDQLKTSEQAINLPAGYFTPAINLPEEKVLDWKDLSPRVGAAYDLFGKGKTSIRFGLARFVNGETQGTTNSLATISKIQTTAGMFTGQSVTWSDKNHDGTIFNPDGSLQYNPNLPPTAVMDPSNPSELGIFSSTLGKLVQSTQIDPELAKGWFKRGYSWEYNVGVQQQLIPRMALNFLFYRRWSGNQTLTYDRAIKPTSQYWNGPFCINRPADSQLPGGGGGQICGLYDINATYVNHVPDNYETFTNKVLGQDLPNHIQGFDVSLNGRFSKAFIQGGFDFIKTYQDNTLMTTLQNPLLQYPIRETPYNGQVKFNGQYTLPWGIGVSGSYNILRGPAIGYSWTAPVGFTRTNGQTTMSVLVSQPDQEHFPFVHQVNLRFNKTFKVKERYLFKPTVDFYNILNSDGITNINTTYAPPGTAGAQWNLPTGIVQPRQFRITAQFQF